MGFYIDVLKPSLVGFPPYLQRPFITNWCWILSNTFSLSADEIIWLFFCSLCIWWIVWLDLNVDPALHFCSKPCSYRIWNTRTHTHTHIFFASILSRNFTCKIVSILAYFFWHCCLNNTGLPKWPLSVFPFFLPSLVEILRVGFLSSLNIW